VQPCKRLGPAVGSEVDGSGLKEEQVGKGLAAGTLALFFFMALPHVHAHRALEKARHDCLKSI